MNERLEALHTYAAGLTVARGSLDASRPAVKPPRPIQRLDIADVTGFVVYRLYAHPNRLLYVGQTTNLTARLGYHQRDPRFRDLHHVLYEQLPTRRAMDDLEAELILRLQPPHNTLGLTRPQPSPEPAPLADKPPSQLANITRDYLRARAKIKARQAQRDAATRNTETPRPELGIAPPEVAESPSFPPVLWETPSDSSR